jgi:hypothetical protein
VNGCDEHWLEAHAALPALHADKSGTYGVEGDRFANFTALARVTGAVPERYAVERLLEKATRALHMIDAALANDVREYPDIASLGLVCHALQYKRRYPADLMPLDEKRAA